MNDNNLLLKVILDSGSIGPSDISKIQKALDRYTVKVSTEPDMEQLIKSVKKLLPKITDDINKIPGMDIKLNIDDGTLKKSIDSFIKEAATESPGKDISTTTDVLAAKPSLQSSTSNLFTEMGKSLSPWVSKDSLSGFTVSKIKEAISELKNLDAVLTEINSSSNLTKKELGDLGSAAFETAGKYGKSAEEYLNTVLKMYRTGIENAPQMAELSMMAQAAGGLDTETADAYLLAGNAAYGLKGNIEGLNRVLDGQNNISNNAAVSMQEMAEATTEAAASASRYGVGIDELSALIAIASEGTWEPGKETGSALSGIFSALQETSGGAVSDSLDKLGISMTEFSGSSEQLKSPIKLLGELSQALGTLPEDSPLREEILNNIGGKDNYDALAAITEGWDKYKPMLDMYSNGMGSAARDAEEAAGSVEASLTRLSSTWTDTVGKIAGSDAIATVINGLNSFLNVINKAAGALGPLGTTGALAGLFAGIKNEGREKCMPSY